MPAPLLVINGNKDGLFAPSGVRARPGADSASTSAQPSPPEGAGLHRDRIPGVRRVLEEAEVRDDGRSRGPQAERGVLDHRRPAADGREEVLETHVAKTPDGWTWRSSVWMMARDYLNRPAPSPPLAWYCLVLARGWPHVHCHCEPHPSQHRHRLLAPPALVRRQHVGPPARHLHDGRPLPRE